MWAGPEVVGRCRVLPFGKEEALSPFLFFFHTPSFLSTTLCSPLWLFSSFLPKPPLPQLTFLVPSFLPFPHFTFLFPHFFSFLYFTFPLLSSPLPHFTFWVVVVGGSVWWRSWS